MGKFISNFYTTAELAAFSATTDFGRPHVSLTKDNSEVHFFDTPSPTPIAVEGAAQVFKDANCTEYASGDMSGKPTVYIRFNETIPAGTRWLDSKQGPGNHHLDFTDGIEFLGSWLDDTFTLPAEASTVFELPGTYEYPAGEISEDMCIYNFIQ